MQPVKSLKCQLSYVRRIHLSLHWHLEIKSGLEFLVLRNVPLYLRRNKSSQSFFDREWSTYGPLDSHNPLYSGYRTYFTALTLQGVADLQ